MTQPLRLLGAGVLLAASIGACGSQAPSWSITPLSAPPAASGASAGAPAPGAAVVDITAKNIAFDQTAFTAAANTPLTVHFDNQDQGVGHDIAIHQGSADGKLEFQGDVVIGPGKIDYQVPALPPGTYTIICTIHPTQMVAPLTVK